MNFSSLKTPAILLLIAALVLISFPYQRASASGDNTIALAPLQCVRDNLDTEGFIIYADEHGNPQCREAVTESERLLTTRNTDVELHNISPAIRTQGANGLTITLRSTSQLDTYPDAKAAFLRAAAFWESLIQNPISIIVDVDFGPNRFGQPFPTDVL